MKRKINYALLCLFLFTMQSILGQENNQSNATLELNGGFAFAGPVRQMENYLVNQGYNATVNSLFFGDVNYPVKTSYGGSLGITYFKDLNSHKKLGLQLAYANLGSITGYNNQGRSVNIGFRTINATGFYAYSYKPWRLKIGLSVQLNTFYEEEFTDKKSIKSEFSAGLFLGGDLYLWNSKRTYGLLSCNYTYTTSNKISPSSDGFEGKEQLPETNISFKHATASFAFGIHL